MSAAAAASSTVDISPTDTRSSRSSSSSSSDDGSVCSGSEKQSPDELCALGTACRSVALLAVRCVTRDETNCTESISTSSGTGFRVGQCYLITAKHVVEPALTVNNELYEADAVTATFMDKPAGMEDLTFTFKRSVLLIHTPNGIGSAFDIAILEFEQKPNPSAAILPPPLKVELTCDASKCVHVIGYPSTMTEQLPSKCFDPACKLVFPHMFCPWDAFPHLDYKEAKREDRYIFYDCWVQHGASGSPVLQYVNGNLAVVAVHVQGFPIDHYINRKKECRSQEEANAFDRKKRKEYRLFEAGVSLGSVYSAMANTLRPIFDL